MNDSENIINITNCKSCDFQFDDNLQFCPNCGGKVILERLTIKSVFQEFYQNIFNIDNKFISTIKDLTLRPEKVFTAYISGGRKKYYNPVSLIAIAIVLSTLTSSLLLENVTTDTTSFQEYAYGIGYKGAGGTEEEFQEKLKNKEFQERFEKSKQEGLETQEKINDFTKNNLGFIAYLNIPIYALIAFLVFSNRKLYNFAEIVSIILFQNAYSTLLGFLITLLFFVLGINIYILGVVSFLVIYIYSNYSFKRLFNLNFKGLIIVNLKFLLVGFVLLILFMMLVVGATILIKFVF